MDVHTEKLISSIDAYIEKLKKYLQALEKTKELLQEFGGGLNGINNLIEEKETPSKTQKKKLPKKQTVAKCVREIVGVRDTKYAVHIYDKNQGKVVYGGTFENVGDAIKKRDQMMEEIKAEAKDHLVIPDPSKCMCAFGWKCAKCGKKYDQRVVPSICIACSSIDFEKQKEKE